MLLLSNRLLDMPVMSLQTGTELAITEEVIIDPRTLTIVALYVDGVGLETHPSVLHIADIREVSSIGFIVNDTDVLMSTDGLVRLQEIINYHFELIGTPVFDEQGTKLGKVSDFAYEPDGYTIQQIYTHQSLLRSLATASNIINRQQIISITNERIVVESPTIKDRIKQNADSARALVNPFKNSPLEPTDRD